MFIKLLIIFSTLFILSYNIGYSENPQNKVLEYKNKKDEFSIVVVKNHTRQEKIKQIAINNAAILAHNNGFNSFDIINEGEVEVILGKTNWPSNYDFPQNLYQEQIIEKGYNREKLISKSNEDDTLRKAYKIIIRCYKDKQGSYKVYEIIKYLY